MHFHYRYINSDTQQVTGTYLHKAGHIVEIQFPSAIDKPLLPQFLKRKKK